MSRRAKNPLVAHETSGFVHRNARDDTESSLRSPYFDCKIAAHHETAFKLDHEAENNDVAPFLAF